jgi:hypothetical protein
MLFASSAGIRTPGESHRLADLESERDRLAVSKSSLGRAG